MSHIPKYLWLINAGHGASQPGKQSPLFKHEGEWIRLYEWALNWDIQNRLTPMLDTAGIQYRIINDNPIARGKWPDRTQVANEIAEQSVLPCLYFGIHFNAFTLHSWQTDAEGVEAYYYPGSNFGLNMARTFAKYIAHTTGRQLRHEAEGGAVARDNLFELRDTAMPACLVEGPFFDNPEEAELLLQPDFRQLVTQGYFNAIRAIEVGEVI
ncbi:MAG: N-acetylmuramoyl-L-alanine amidase [Bdellovibrionales bacterium]|nr:N-acetylmuramoyl-L-alanine amidase [Bdellovibrionales bacterium]